MRWTLPSSKAGLAVMISLFLVVSASVGFVTLGLFDGGQQPSDNGNTTTAGEPDSPQAAGLRGNCTNASFQQAAPLGRQLPNTSTAAGAGSARRPRNPVSAMRSNGTMPSRSINTTRSRMRTTRRGICQLAELFEPPAWVDNVTTTANASADRTFTSQDTPTAEPQNTSAATMEAQRALGQDLRAILADESRSQRAAVFDAGGRTLAARRQLAADGYLDSGFRPQLATTQTKLRGARELLETESAVNQPTNSQAVRLATRGFKLQAAQLNQSAESSTLTDVSLQTEQPPTHDKPSAAAFAILDAQDVEPTAEQAADIRTLDDLPESTRRELTDYLDAYLGYYRASQELSGGENRTRQGNSSGPAGGNVSAADLRRVRAAQLRLLQAAGDLQAVFDDAGSSGVADAASDGPGNTSVRINGTLSIDLSTNDNTYSEDYALQIDVGGDDTYNNNAGGANNSATAAALADFGGRDMYNGRNGGGFNGAGFLFDARGDDTYEAQTKPVQLSNFGKSCDTGGCGTNGGAFRGGVGFLLDAGGSDSYTAGDKGTNGGAADDGNIFSADRPMAGFLLDVGPGADTFDAGDDGTNGGAVGELWIDDKGIIDGIDHLSHGPAVGFLMNAGSDDDTYNGGSGGTNGASGGVASGFLLDAGGTDTYDAGELSNGAGAFSPLRVSHPEVVPTPRLDAKAGGFLLDAGTGNDTYDAGDSSANGGATADGVGFLLDVGGSDTYDARVNGSAGGGGGTNGGAQGGTGFLLDGGTGDDTYAAKNMSLSSERASYGGTNGGATARRQVGGSAPEYSDASGVQQASGFLWDAGGDDTYHAGKFGTNGGGYKLGAGFLVDSAGNDTYSAKFNGVNGGGALGTGLLLDGAGTDVYSEQRRRCRDCSEIPKGAVGAQVDRGGGGDQGGGTGPTQVLVVDDDAGGAGAACPEASYETVQNAVDAAERGDTVRVCGGTYAGGISVNTSNVTLRAGTPGQVVLDGAATQRPYGVLLKGANITVTGFTARNFTGRDAAAFVSHGPQNTITATIVRNSTYGIIATGYYTNSGLGGMLVGEDPHATVISNNTVWNVDYGILLDETGNVNVSGNTVTAAKYGIDLYGATGVTIHDNIVSGHAFPRTINQRGISVGLSQDVTITGNRVTGYRAPANRTFDHTYAPFGHGYGLEILNPSGFGEDTTHTLRNNTLANNTYNLQVYSSDHTAYRFIDIDTSNTVDGKPVYYLHGATNRTIGPADNPGYVACVDCVNVTVRDIELAHNGQGVLFAKSIDSHVKNVTVHDTWAGVSLVGSPRAGAVTDSTIRESYNAIAVRHQCENRINELLFNYQSADVCAPTGPSVLIADNTIRDTGSLFGGGGVYAEGNHRYLGRDTSHGGAITATGGGVSVRRNTIRDAYGAGISLKTGEAYPGDREETLKQLKPDAYRDGTVANNSVSGAFAGIIAVANQGTTFTDNEITDTRVGLFNIYNRELTYRDNTVTNATYGMFIHFGDQNITAHNNSFREVDWGLHVQFTWFAYPPNAPASHDFGTSNTVNGERILWLDGATDRVIDATDANMVVCVECVNVTVRDMSLTDNAHGVVFWESVNSRIANVTVTDTVQTGVTIVGGQQNVVRDSTIIDSTRGINVQPLNRRQAESRETVGAVRLVNNHVTVENASWPAAPYSHITQTWTRPLIFGHWGIYLLNPTTATVADNRVTDTQTGIDQQVAVLAERHPEDRDYSAMVAQNLRIVNNTINHSAQPKGLMRPEQRKATGVHRTLGIRLNTKKARLPNASITVRNNTLTDPGVPSTEPKWGIKIATDAVPSVPVEANTVRGYEQSVSVLAAGASASSGVSIRRNSLIGASQASVVLPEIKTKKGKKSTNGETVAIHGNLLQPQATGSSGYGVLYANGTQTVNATCNQWGAPSGPSSLGGRLTDPVTGVSADGNGSAVSRSDTDGEANVRFDPWVDEPPHTTCKQDEGPIPTPTPTPQNGTGDTGSGPGDGPGEGGQGNDSGADSGNSDDPGQQGTAAKNPGTASETASPPQTSSSSPTQPQIATPEIVAGFGVGAVLVALVILLGVLAVRRRD